MMMVCKHKETTEEKFVNMPHIKFKRCVHCGDEQYPPGFVRINEGKTVTILWPL